MPAVLDHVPAAKSVDLRVPAATAPCQPAFDLYGGREIRKWPVLLAFPRVPAPLRPGAMLSPAQAGSGARTLNFGIADSRSYGALRGRTLPGAAFGSPRL
jgi:hypothetical protein